MGQKYTLLTVIEHLIGTMIMMMIVVARLHKNAIFEYWTLTDNSDNSTYPEKEHERGWLLMKCCTVGIGFNGAETNCGIAHTLGILLMNSCNTVIFLATTIICSLSTLNCFIWLLIDNFCVDNMVIKGKARKSSSRQHAFVKFWCLWLAMLRSMIWEKDKSAFKG